MDYVPHSKEDREAMLRAIGVASSEDLFHDIPADVRHPHLDMPPGMSEPEVIRHLQALGQQNRNVQEMPSFLGAGCYNHFIPSIVSALILRGEFLHELYAVPAGTRPRHVAGHVRVSEHGLPAHRYGRGERQHVRRGHRHG